MNKLVKQIAQATNLSTQQAWWLLEFITNKKRTQLQYTTIKLSQSEQMHLDESLKQISVHNKPLAYILGWVPFLDLQLIVQPPTLIPRPETEAWVDKLITMIKDSKTETLRILDIGTGSGCIALSLAQAFPTSQIYALDIAHSAIELAQKNAHQNDITNITFLESDLFSNLSTDMQFDLIVSNPPYINPAVQLEASVAAWEDHGALFAENCGMRIIEKIIKKSHLYVKKNDALDFQLIIEIDASQGDAVKKVLEDFNFKNIEIKKDQFDRDRTAWAKL